MAAALTVDLTWNAPYAECPAREHVLEEAGGILGASRASGSPVAVRADIERVEEARWRAVLTVDAAGTRSVRHFEARSCDGVASAAALIVAIAAEGGPLPEEPTTEDTSAPRALAPAPSPRPSARSQLAIEAGAAVDDGLLPAPAGGAEIAAGWALGLSRLRLRVLASSSLFVAQDVVLSTGDGASFQLFAFGIRGCPALRAGPMDVGACAGAEIETMAAGGFGAHPESHIVSWASGLGSALVTWSPSEHVAIYGRADLLVPVERPLFYVGQLGPAGIEQSRTPVHQPAAVTARGAIGVELRFF
ncbi:MAG TPA: hypothetical protein VKU41_31445 [Polyangiaceae bacterium]|nr:hypothetical protein [Polyangiaceae bacterium]